MANPDTTVRVIKRGTCPTLSGKSELTYCLGDYEGDLMIRIHSNDGGGFFSNEWLPVSKLVDTLEACDPDKPITSVALGSLFRGKSVNSRAFLMAALKAEGILTPVEGKQRCHELGDVEGFLAQARQLQSGKKKPASQAKAAPRKKPAAKSKATPGPAKGRKKSA